MTKKKKNDSGPADREEAEMSAEPKKKRVKKQPVAAAPSGEVLKVPEVLVAPQEGRCQDCGQLTGACHEPNARGELVPSHTVVTLVKDVQVNGVLYRAGNTTLPAGAWHAFKYAMKES
jgi:hypothetical protein